MGRYQISYSKKTAGYTDKPEIHPIWRGVGFAMMVIIPVISYFAGTLLINENKIRHWVPIPPDFVAKITGDPDLYLKIILTVTLSLVIYMLFMVVTFVTHRLFGPNRYGPVDAPPTQRKARKRWK